MIKINKISLRESKLEIVCFFYSSQLNFIDIIFAFETLILSKILVKTHNQFSRRLIIYVFQPSQNQMICEFHLAF